MIDWTDLLATMLGDLADEWPAETAADGRTVLLPCLLCEHAPVTDAIVTDSGPVHVYHDAPSVLRVAIHEEHLSPRVMSVRLRALEVGTFTYHPAGVIVTTLDGQRWATEATRMDALLDLWGYTEAGAA